MFPYKLARAILIPIAIISVATTVSAQDRTASIQRLRMVVIGDSMAQGVAAGLQQTAVRSVRIEGRGVQSSGIARASVAARSLRVQDGVITYGVLVVGSNESGGVRSAKFAPQYEQSLITVIRNLQAHGIVPVIVGPQSSGRTGQQLGTDLDMSRLHEIFEGVARKTEAIFVNLRQLTQLGGRYSPAGWNNRRCSQQTRDEDGIHFTNLGYRLIAGAVLQAVEDDITAKTGEPFPIRAMDWESYCNR